MSDAVSQAPGVPRVRRVILGTAGHIDHGKTTLVERLTGLRTDRLPEERARGMTIDVGYATFRLPDGTEVGLLDVPGHERLVRTMVAAATAMDLALLVVAADDGPMPQTREHVEILDVLGVTRLVVALTKTDLVDEETAQLAAEEVRELLAPTGMAGAPVVPVSSATGAGLEALRAAIAAAMPPGDARGGDPRVFRMPVLRRFVAEGRGVVVTGIPVAGRLEVGERVDVLPGGGSGRVRGIQVHHRDAPYAAAGHRAALALSDVDLPHIERGMVIATAGVLAPARRLAARLTLLGGVAAPLAHGARARLHLGSGQVPVRVHLPAREPLAPGGVALAEFEAGEPLVAAPGDRFVLRTENASDTLGGGVVIEVLAQRLPSRRAGLIEDLLARAGALEDPAALILGSLKGEGERGLGLADLAARTALQPAGLAERIEALAARGEVRRLGRAERWIHAPAFDQVTRRLDEAVRRLHARDPALDALPLSAVRAALQRVEPAVLEEALAHLVAKGRLVRTPGGDVRHASHSAELPEADRARCARIQAALAAGAGQPPGVDDLTAELGLDRGQVLRALHLLASRGRVFQAADLWFDGAWLAAARERLRDHARRHGGFTPSDARTLLGSTRKWVIPLLEALDKSGFTRRVGDRRVVREGER